MRSDVVPLTISLYRRLKIKYQSWTQTLYRSFNGSAWATQQCTALSRRLPPQQQNQQISLETLLQTASSSSNHAENAECNFHTTNYQSEERPGWTVRCHLHCNQHTSNYISKTVQQAIPPTSPQPFSPTAHTQWPSLRVPAGPKRSLGPRVGMCIVVYVSSPQQQALQQAPQPGIMEMEMGTEMLQTSRTRTTRARTQQTQDHEEWKGEWNVSKSTFKTELDIMLRIERRQSKSTTTSRRSSSLENQTRRATRFHPTWTQTNSKVPSCVVRRGLQKGFERNMLVLLLWWQTPR